MGPRRPTPKKLPVGIGRLKKDGPFAPDVKGTLWTVLGAAALPFVLAFVVLAGYVPHLDLAEDARAPGLASGLLGLGEAYTEFATDQRDDYEYTLHVDENHHWAGMAQLQRQDTLTFDEPYLGTPGGGPFHIRGSVHEKGFHIAVAQFQELTGIPWPVLFRFLPALWLGVTAWGLWAALRPWPGAPVAAAFVALMPTSARFLGPGFLVPIGFGLAWIPVVAILARESFDHRRSPAFLVLAILWGFLLHFMIGFASLLLVACMIPWTDHPRRAGVLVLVSSIPIVWLFNNFFDELEFEATRLGFLPNDRTVFTQIGALFLLVWVLGVYLMYLRPPERHRSLLLGFTLASFLAMAMIAVNFAFALNSYFLYDRWHQLFVLFATVPAAHGVVEVARWVMRHPIRRVPTRTVAAASAVLLSAGILQVGIEGHLRERYYHVLEDPDWESIAWAVDNVGPEYGSFLTDPWKAPIVNALTGKRPVTVLYPGSPPLRQDVWEAYLAGGFADAVFLLENDITWTIAVPPAQAPEYEKLGPGIYGLKTPYLERYNDAVGAP